ncbi:expressed unknown protein [Seminavis robusta]|uniref:Uncharacterized protein n=1 Tax=Seminavis robusta TaxID=568900 RepID=A0A9N8HEV4_9STRA|nr:expressed unknown protein [Seminavis robusta]|eukprot:Sro403_g135690.1 n/a (499) ;mRNA; r:36407-38025
MAIPRYRRFTAAKTSPTNGISKKSSRRKLPLLVFFFVGFLATHFTRKLLKNVEPEGIVQAGRQLAVKLITSSSSSAELQTPSLPTAKVVFVVSLTSCLPKFKRTLFDAASVLRRSIELNTYPLHPNASYQADLVALLPTHLQQPNGCGSILEQAGFDVRIVPLPVSPDEIRGGEGFILKDAIHRNGCCGHSELLKLHAFSMVNHSVAVHLDIDTLLLAPLDELLDAIYYDPATSEQGIRARRHLVEAGLVAPTYPHTAQIQNVTTRIDAFYTKDYNIIRPGQESRVGVQGGFFVVRPNITRRDELIDMVKQGHFVGGRSVTESGWFSSGYGMHIWGAMTIQGLFAYYFDMILKNQAIELHRCRFNQIADNPRRSSHDRTGKYARPTPANASAEWYDTTCRDGRNNCDDVQCQTWPLEDTRIVHYTYCKVPWGCMGISDPPMFWNDGVCRGMISRWFDIRTKLKGQEEADGTYQPEIYNGFCRDHRSYIPMIPHPNTTI